MPREACTYCTLCQQQSGESVPFVRIGISRDSTGLEIHNRNINPISGNLPLALRLRTRKRRPLLRLPPRWEIPQQKPRQQQQNPQRLPTISSRLPIDSTKTPNQVCFRGGRPPNYSIDSFPTQRTFTPRQIFWSGDMSLPFQTSKNS